MTEVQCPECDGYGENGDDDICLTCGGDGSVPSVGWPIWWLLGAIIFIAGGVIL